MDAKDYQVIAAQVLKILKKDKKEQGIWDVYAAANKRDIMELQSTIAESKNSLEKGHRNIEIDKKKIKNYYPVFRDRLPNIETVIAILSEPDPRTFDNSGRVQWSI